MKRAEVILVKHGKTEITNQYGTASDIRYESDLRRTGTERLLSS